MRQELPYLLPSKQRINRVKAIRKWQQSGWSDAAITAKTALENSRTTPQVAAFKPLQ
jgi:hypothetical protein